MAGLFLQKLSLNKPVRFSKYKKECSCFGDFSCISAPKRLFHVSLPLFKAKGNEEKASEKCVEKCSKKQREVLTALGYAQNRYLQPRTPMLSGHKFSMSPPKVEPYVDVYIEEACRIREECKAIREGKKKN